MRLPVELGEATAPSLLDGALALALSTGAPLRLVGPLNGADAAVVMAAARIGDAERLDAARAALSRSGPVEIVLGHARVGVHVLDLREDGAVPRALWALSWPLALLGRPSELRLSGPNHCEGLATFHDLRLGWVPLAGRFGLKVALELPLAGFDGENGELIAALDPAPALTPLQLVHRGILRQVTVVAATAQGRVAERLGRFLAAGGALDGRTAERLLVAAILCAAGLGARAGTAPTCHFTTSSVPEGLVSLATLARRMLPVKAVVDGAVGEEGVVVVAPSA